jgi:hypothetical protein
METVESGTRIVQKPVGEALRALIPNPDLPLQLRLSADLVLEQVTIRYDGNRFTARAIGSISARAAGGLLPVGEAGIASCGIGEPRPQIKVTLTGRISLDRYGNAAPAFDPHSQQWIRPCRITALQINLDAILDILRLRDNLEAQVRRAIQRLGRTQDLQRPYERMWNVLRAPIHVDSVTRIAIQPEAIRIEEPVGHGDSLSVSVRLSARPLLLSGDDVPIDAPEFPGVTVGSVPDTFRIRLTGSVGIAQANQLLSQSFDSASIQSPIGTIRINAVELFSVGDSSVAVGLRVRSPFRGWVYGTGQLEVDADADLACVRNFDYTVESTQFLVEALMLYSIHSYGMRFRSTCGSHLPTGLAGWWTR